jgi:hypothetical protein
MATPTTGAPPGARAQPAYEQQEARGTGWVTFAGVMVGIVGALNVIYGIAAISNSRFFFREGTYILTSLNTYGWLAVIIGAVQVGAMLAIFARERWGRWVGIASASINALVQMTWIGTYPLASLALLAINILVIYGLVAYGHRAKAAF